MYVWSLIQLRHCAGNERCSLVAQADPKEVETMQATCETYECTYWICNITAVLVHLFQELQRCMQCNKASLRREVSLTALACCLLRLMQMGASRTCWFELDKIRM